jgi:hypothetical protein
MNVQCKIFPTAIAARGAMNAVKAAWTPPALVFVNVTIPALRALTNVSLILCDDAYELTDGRWALIAEHAQWKTDTIDDSLIKRPETTVPQAAPGNGKGRP